MYNGFIGQAHQKFLIDLLPMVERLSNNLSIPKSEAFDVDDTLTAIRGLFTSLIETAAVVDTKSMQAGLEKKEFVGMLTDVLAKGFQKALIDSSTLTDTVRKDLLKVLVEIVSLLDTFDRTVVYDRLLVDNLVTSDTITNAAAYNRTFTESVTLADILRTLLLLCPTFHEFLDAMKALFETGFVKNGVQFLGTGSGKLLRLQDYTGTEIPFKILTALPKTEEFAFQTPWLSIGNIAVDDIKVVGGKLAYLIRVTLDGAWTIEHHKVVDAETLNERDLGLYLEEEVRKALRLAPQELTDIQVSHGKVLKSRQEKIGINNTTLFGFRIRAEFRVTC